jgi:hypothetical protein
MRNRSLAPLVAALVLAACAKGKPDRTFLFGTAIAGFQADMGCPTLPRAQCEDPHSDWFDWITRPELQQDPRTHLSGQPPSTGPGFYELYNDDLARDLKSVASPAALAYYHARSTHRRGGGALRRLRRARPPR